MPAEAGNDLARRVDGLDPGRADRSASTRTVPSPPVSSAASSEGSIVAPGADGDVTGEWPVWTDFNKMNEEALHKAELLVGPADVDHAVHRVRRDARRRHPADARHRRHRDRLRAHCTCSSWISPISVWSMNFSMMIGLAVGIDYSLFIVCRYREERVEGKDAIKAIENAMSTSGKAVFLSALTVVLSLSAVFLVPVMVFQTMALGMIISVIAVALAALTLLPAVLVAMGDKVLVSRGKKDPDIVAEGRWAKWTGVALRRPGIVLTIGLVRARCADRPGVRHEAGHARRPRRRSRVTPAATATTWSSTSFGPGAAGPAYVTVDAADAQTGDRHRHRHPERRRRPHRRATGRDRPGRRPRHPRHADRQLGDRRHGRRTCAASSTSTVPNAKVGGPGGPEPRPHQRARRPRPVRDRHHPDRRVPAAARGVPQRRHRHVLHPDEPRHRRRRVRVRHPRVPARLRHRPHRHRAPGLRRRLGTAVLLRPAVRPLDGLPAVPARRDQGALPGHRRHPPRHRRRHRPHRPTDHQRRRSS